MDLTAYQVKKMKEQSDKCDFRGYTSETAARDAIMYQTSNNKLRKKILAKMTLHTLVVMQLWLGVAVWNVSYFILDQVQRKAID